MVVIGAGVAGLVSALQLAQRGLQVTLLEAAEQPGGKMRQLMVDGGPIDSGPTVFTMRWVFEQVYGSVGASSRSAHGFIRRSGAITRCYRAASRPWRGHALHALLSAGTIGV